MQTSHEGNLSAARARLGTDLSQGSLVIVVRILYLALLTNVPSRVSTTIRSPVKGTHTSAVPKSASLLLGRL